jgi:hypothetical protein
MFGTARHMLFFVIFGEGHLRHLLGEFVPHYNGECCRQGIGGKRVMAKVDAENDNGTVETIKARSRLGGTLNFYHSEAS